MEMEGGSNGMVRIDRKSSIENEPRTLNMNQFQFDRDAALYVANTRSIEEALRIFTQGLEPVVSVAEQNNGTTMMMDTGEEFDCSGSALRVSGLRDIASAPF